MRDLTDEEKQALERISQSHLHKRGNYFYFTFRNKHYKRSRVLLQLHLNKRLEVWEHVHHKNMNKEDDSLENLEVRDASVHSSLHHAGTRGRKNKPRDKTNKLSQAKINKILELSKTIKNYSEIGRKVGVASFTVAKYIKRG